MTANNAIRLAVGIGPMSISMSMIIATNNSRRVLSYEALVFVVLRCFGSGMAV